MHWIRRLFVFLSVKFVPEASAKLREEADELSAPLAAYFDAHGGASAVVRRFEALGFAGKVRSWISGDPIRTINSVEVLQLIGWKDLRQMSEASGIPLDRLRDLLADALPVAIRNAFHAA